MKIKVSKMTAEKISEEEALKMTNFECLDEVREKLAKWQEANEKRGFLILGYNEDGFSFFWYRWQKGHSCRYNGFADYGE